jgi:hypothetical protein
VLPRRTLPALLLVTALIAGCGGGGDSGPQTKEGFIAEADSVCESVAGRLAEGGTKDPRTPQEIADANNTLADVYGELSDGLAEVRLPDRGPARAQAEAFVASVRSADPLLKNLRVASDRFVDAAKTKSPRTIATAGNALRTTLDAFRAARAASDRLAIAYGLNVCGNLG